MVQITRSSRRKVGRDLLRSRIAGLLSRDDPGNLRRDQSTPAPGPANQATTPRPPSPARQAEPETLTAPTTPSPKRAEPELRWNDARVVPKTGSFAPCAVANAALVPESVPTEADGWERLNEFALGYDGYAYWDNLPELAHRSLAHWTRNGSQPETLDELRACLFFEQRRWHHFGDTPSGRSAEYLWALADAIRDLVTPTADSGDVAAGAAVTDAAAVAGSVSDVDGTRRRPEAPVSFVDDDAGFLAWMAQHRSGYVLNSRRKPSARHLKLHRAACSSIAPGAEASTGAGDRTWTVTYRKVCATDLRALVDWGSAQFGVSPDPCKRCKP